MTDNYLQIMIESLEKKNEVLDKIEELDQRQLQMALAADFDEVAYDKLMDEKGELIDLLDKYDEGFQTTYELVRDKVQADTQKYRDKVLIMQDLIREAVEKGVSIEAKEKRNKEAIAVVLNKKRQKIHEKKVSVSAANKYYKAMSQVNYVDPQLMEYKK